MVSTIALAQCASAFVAASISESESSTSQALTGGNFPIRAKVSLGYLLPDGLIQLFIFCRMFARAGFEHVQGLVGEVVGDDVGDPVGETFGVSILVTLSFTVVVDELVDAVGDSAVVKGRPELLPL